MNKPTKIIIVLAVASGLFYGGFAYGQSSSSANPTANTTSYSGTRTARTGGTGGFAGGSATVGTVVSSDSTSITLALKSGSVVVFYSTSTPIMKTTTGSRSDISAGENITVLGTANSDGSITANSIQLRQAIPTAGQ